MSGQHAGVQAFIRRAYKNAQYVHCYAHQLSLIVEQATSQNQQVLVFFPNLSDITNFFNKSPQRIAILKKMKLLEKGHLFVQLLDGILRVEPSIKCMNIGNS
ncbi:hypothetical protein AVEN_249829-1 [Araneus ventricosus]|uniref:DUF4371 domain-containing protein n=1 Tax=Araneus ventricosus TaxID=182803 RepID=A0A4Y2LLE2_ARAVE|nr:hypothetical protein AVEN_249829-1 [Araneus ventricosus]